MLTLDLHTHDIPDIYAKFATLIGERHWTKRAADIRQEIRGNKFLQDHLTAENEIAFQLDHLHGLTQKYGRVPLAEGNNRNIYPAASFAAQALSLLENTPRGFAEGLKRRIHGALKNPGDMRGLRLELTAATHFGRRGRKVVWPEMTGLGTFDFLIEDVGRAGLELECKSFSADKGRKVTTREVLDFFGILWPYLAQVRGNLVGGISAVLTIPGRLPTRYADRVALAKGFAAHIAEHQSGELASGDKIRVGEFNVNKLGRIPVSGSPEELRSAIDDVTATANRQSMVFGTVNGGALAMAVESESDDEVLDAIFLTLKDSAVRQFSGKRAAMFFAGLDGIDATQLLDLAGQDQDPEQPPTGLQERINRFLGSDGRDHVVGVGFLSSGALRPVEADVVESGGAAYYFPKRESPMWSEDFSGLFAWR